MNKWAAILSLAAMVMLSFASQAKEADFSVRHISNNCDETSLNGQLPRLVEELPAKLKAGMEKGKIPGITMGIIEGECEALWGFGLADVSAERVVDPNITGFRIGSITKTFVMTAILQLAEKGLVDMEADIETYIPGILRQSDFRNPIRVRHLMSHTAGFEDAVLGHLFFDKASDVRPVREYLLEFQPERVREPDVLPAYSNYGFVLAGHLIETVSGMPFHEYIEKNILQPLGMDHSVVDDRFADEATYSQPYAAGNNTPLLQKRSHASHMAAAGGIIAPSADMVAYMRSQLQGFRGEGTVLFGGKAKSILDRWRAEELGWNNSIYGFARGQRNGHETLGHGGATPGFGSSMTMVPAANLGIFMSANVMAGVGLNYKVTNEILDAVLGARTQTRKTVVEGVDLSRYTGFYKTERRSYTKAEAFTSLIRRTETISSDNDQYLVTAGGKLWEPVGNHIFQEKDGTGLLWFKTNAAGEITHLRSGASAASKVVWYAHPISFVIAAAMAFVGFVSALVIAWRKRKSEVFEDKTGVPFLSRLLGIVGLLTFLSITVTVVDALGAPGISYVYGFPNTYFMSSLWLIMLLVVCVVVYSVRYVKALSSGELTTRQTVWYGALAIISLAFLAWLHHLNLIGLQYFPV